MSIIRLMNKSSLQTRCCANDTLGNFSDAARNYIDNKVRITNINTKNGVRNQTFATAYG